MSTPLLARFEKLLALTLSPNEEEARNAAILVCRMIQEGKLRVVDPLQVTTQPEKKTAKVAMPTAPGTVDHMREQLEAILGKGHMAIPPPGVRPADVLVVRMEATHAGMCRHCDAPYFRGSTVWARQGFGAVHEACRKEALL